MSLYSKELKLLKEKSLDYGINLSEHHLALFSLYLEELIEWNRRMNLTGLSHSGRIIIELFLDSLIPVSFIPSEGRMLDVGSGAGFPGIVIKVYHPGLQTDLLESNAKKTSFLKQIIRLLKIDNIKVINNRLETAGNELSLKGYHIITSRAVARLNKIIEWCSPLLSSNGILVVFLGAEPKRDLNRNRAAIDTNCLSVNKLLTYSLPGKDSERTLAIFKKSLP